MKLPKNKGYKIDDKPYKECLKSISKYCKNYGIAGGSGVSLQVCSKSGVEATRRTDDVDISIYPQLTKSEMSFQFGKDIQEYLDDEGYFTEFNKPHANYEIKVMEKEPNPSSLKAVKLPFHNLVGYDEEPHENNSNLFFMHFSRRSKKYLDRFEERIKREVENAYEVKIPDTEDYILVIRPEDLILPKLMRRKEKDIFDIGLLIKYTELDKNYLKEHASDWYHEEKLTGDMLDIFEELYDKYKI